MYESSGSQFCRTTTGTQPVPDALNESRFVITFLTILGVRNIMQFQISSRRENRWTNTRAIKIRAFRKVSRKQFFYQMQKITPSGCWIEEVSGFSISILVVVVVGRWGTPPSPIGVSTWFMRWREQLAMVSSIVLLTPTSIISHLYWKEGGNSVKPKHM